MTFMQYPKHIGIIPDWNRTWAQNQWLPKFAGHLEGFNKIVENTKYIFSNTDTKVLSVWWLSTENNKWRDWEELSYLYWLYKKIPSDLFSFLQEQRINFKRVWKLDWLPQSLIDFLYEKQKELSFDSDRYLVLAVNYWWRDEILRGVKYMLDDNSDVKCEQLSKQCNEGFLSKYLDFYNLPNIELVIRTKWDYAKRLSWFMLWWIWYAELYFTKKLCPELDTNEINNALVWFDEIVSHRNFGK